MPPAPRFQRQLQVLGRRLKALSARITRLEADRTVIQGQIDDLRKTAAAQESMLRTTRPTDPQLEALVVVNATELSQPELVMAILKLAGKPMRSVDLLAAMSFNGVVLEAHSHLAVILNRLLVKARIRRVERATYALTSQKSH